MNGDILVTSRAGLTTGAGDGRGWKHDKWRRFDHFDGGIHHLGEGRNAINSDSPVTSRVGFTICARGGTR